MQDTEEMLVGKIPWGRTALQLVLAFLEEGSKLGLRMWGEILESRAVIANIKKNGCQTT